VHLIELVEYLFEAVEEGVATRDHNGFLRPNMVVVFKLGVLQLAFESSGACLVEEKNCSVVTLTFAASQDEVERLRVLMRSMELDTHRETEVCDALLEWLLGPVLSGISIKDFGSESCFEEVDFHE
jgi:hypothetical protein